MKTGQGRGIKVAIIDSGVELTHPSLNHLRLLEDIELIRERTGEVRRAPNWGKDSNGHGTAIASILLAEAPEVQIGSFHVLDEGLWGSFPAIKEAAILAIERGYHIINLSIGTKQPTAIDHFKPWIDYAYTQGVHVVAACNNDNFRNGEYPGYFPSVITVNMANTPTNELYFRLDPPRNGKITHLVEFAARGWQLENLPGNNGKLIPKVEACGSSYAAPLVAGKLARLLSVYPKLKPLVAKSLLQEAAERWNATLSTCYIS